MKKLIFGGLAILLALSLIVIACDAEIGGNEDPELGYTDVEYSIDGKSMTLYLEGTVPESRSSRALTDAMAKSGHDFFEVVFVSGGVVARTSWEIGESAGIKNVPRGVDYAAATSAILFVGRKADKTLLAVGLLTAVDDAAPVNATTVTVSTSKVTFTIQSIIAGLPNAPTSTGDVTAAAGDTFLLAAPAPTAGTPVNTATTYTAANYSDYKFPAYKLQPDASNVTGASYQLGGIVATHMAGIKVVEDGTASIRIPRFPIGSGNYRDLPGPYASAVTASITITADAALSTLTGAIPIVITPGEIQGVCSLSFEVPVYAIQNNTTAIGDVPASTIWKLKPGFGTSVFDLDDGPGGKSRGGAILLAVGVVNYLNIGTSGL